MRVATLGSPRIDRVLKPLKAVGVQISDDIGKADVLLVDTPGLTAVRGWMLKRRRGCKLILRLRGDYWKEIRTEGRLSAVRAFLSRVIFRLCDEVVAVSWYLRKRMAEEVGLFPKVVEIPARDDLACCQCEEFNVVTLTNFNYIEKVRPLMTFGRVIDEFLRDVNGHWLVAGRGKYLRTFLDRMRDLRRLRYCGYVDVRDFLRMGKVMVHLSEFEGLPNAVLEGMAAGMPVIVNDYPALTQIFGVIVIRDGEELMYWLKRLYENPKERRRIGELCRRVVMERYRVERIGLKFYEILKCLSEDV